MTETPNKRYAVDRELTLPIRKHSPSDSAPEQPTAAQSKDEYIAFPCSVDALSQLFREAPGSTSRNRLRTAGTDVWSGLVEKRKISVASAPGNAPGNARTTSGQVSLTAEERKRNRVR